MEESELTVKGIRILRQQMEIDISAILNRFEIQTGMQVFSLTVNHNTSLKGNYEPHYTVRSGLLNPFES